MPAAKRQQKIHDFLILTMGVAQGFFDRDDALADRLTVSVPGFSCPCRPSIIA
jgi:hypothetical protein